MKVSPVVHVQWNCVPLINADFEASMGCVLLAGPVDVAGAGAGVPSLGLTFDLLPHPSIGLAEAFQSG